ncbi:hypothetical protein PHSC3_001690 [Chlamydiales bacterium STE3]|nr:hypothetical protein PHSC3_001690 [Chlamydiales bacterium STE3]
MDIASTSSYQSLLRLQDSLLARLNESSFFSAEGFTKDIDTVITKLWNSKNAVQNISEALLKMHKITKKIFTHPELGKLIWENLNQQNKNFLRIFQPYLASPELPATQIDTASLQQGSTCLFTCPNNQRFHVKLEAKLGSYCSFTLVDSPSTALIFCENKNGFLLLFDYREGLGISTCFPKKAVSVKGQWLMREVNREGWPQTLNDWLKTKQTDAMVKSVAQQVIETFHFEREFGVELYKNKSVPFMIFSNKIHSILAPPLILPESSFILFNNYKVRHQSVIEVFNECSKDLGSQLITQYEKLQLGPNENIFNVLKKARINGLISSKDLQKADSMAYQIAYALQAAQEKTGDLIAIPWEKIDSTEDLFAYLNFVIRSTTKREDLSSQLFTAAKKLLKNIPRTEGGLKRGLLDRPNHLSQEIESQLSPLFLKKNFHSPAFDLIDQLLEETQSSPEKSNKASIEILCSFISQEYKKQNTPSKELLREKLDELKLRIKEEQHENFTQQDLSIRNDLTAILYNLILEHYLNKDTSLDDFLDDLLEKIKKQLNADESLKMVEKQIDEDGGVKDSFYDPVLTPGDYFITLFWQEFHDQLRNLSKHKLPSDPLGDLACLRVLHAVAPYEKKFIDRQLEKVLKDNYKKVSRQKLEKELKSRLEKFTGNL